MKTKIDLNDIIDEMFLVKFEVTGFKRARLRVWVTLKLIWLIGAIGLPVKVEVV